jgi:hypothetical protein
MSEEKTYDLQREREDAVDEANKLRGQCAELTRKVCEMEDACMEADFLRSQFDALGIVVESSVEDWGNGLKATTRLTRNARADALQALNRDLAEALQNIKKNSEVVAPTLAPYTTAWKIADVALAKIPKE